MENPYPSWIRVFAHEGFRILLKMQEVLGRYVSPSDAGWGGAMGVALVENVEFSAIKNASVGIVHPSFGDGAMAFASIRFLCHEIIITKSHREDLLLFLSKKESSVFELLQFPKPDFGFVARNIFRIHRMFFQKNSFESRHFP